MNDDSRPEDVTSGTDRPGRPGNVRARRRRLRSATAGAPAAGTALLAATAVALVGAVAGCGGTRGGDAPEDRGPVRGGASAVTEWAGLRYEIVLLPSDVDRIRARATVRNEARSRRSLPMPWCLVWLRLYRDGRLVWDAGEERGCGGLVRFVELSPGEEDSFGDTVFARDVLGEGRPPGEYTVRAYLPGSTRPGIPRAEMELTLGSVVLERP